jgi:hypothetical protein
MTDHTERHDVEDATHRAGCAECRALWAELEAIGAEAAQLPLLTPSRDLWSGIEARIATAPRRLPFHRRQSVRLAIAASLLVAVSSAVTWQLASRAPTALPAATVAVTEATPDGAVDAEDAAAYVAAFSASVTQMDREIAALQSIVSERRGDLDPATLAVLERNLSVIDAAIAESREALAADPASQFLAQQFTRAYTSKITLLRGAAQLPAGL